MTEQFHSISLLVPEIRELLAAKNFSLLKQVLRECNPIELADGWRRFLEEERVQIFKLLSAKTALKLFEILELDDQKALLAKLSEESVTPLLEGMDSPDLVKIFHRMSPRSVKKMTGLIKRQEALAHIDLVMKFKENSAGSLMHPEFIKLSPKMSAKQALLLIQAIVKPNQKEHLFSLFVTDDHGKLLGALSLQDLIGAAEDEKLSEIMASADRIKVKPETDQEEVSKLFSKYDLSAVPVVDDESKLMGILTVKDILSVLRQEETEDIAKMAGTQASDVYGSSVLKAVRYRMPWLLVTLAGGLVISRVISSFEETLAKILALAAFSPLIAGMGGNVGSQSATIVVRSLVLGQINGHQKMKTVLRELKVGLLLGLSYGIMLGLIAYLVYGAQYGIRFSAVVAAAMATSMTIAATLGAAGPLTLQRMGVDPATATGPLISTTTDIISNITYFTLATLLLLYW